ncbi:MAG: NnrU family protein [Gammaproteobacteria bacterium]|nr:NnrU family protein [Gammaproteobacteria bacterium]
MSLLVLGLVIFFAVHLVPAVPSLRAALVLRFGHKGYRMAFALTALVGLILIIWGKGRAPYVPVYDAPGWGRHATQLLMLPALILLPAAHMPGNIKRYTRHPMLWGVLLFALGHLLANGDLASLLLFGAFALYAPLAMVSANVRGARLATAAQPWVRDLRVVAAGVITYLLLAWLHPWLFGAAAFVRS